MYTLSGYSLIILTNIYTYHNSWLNLKNIKLSNRRQTQKISLCDLISIQFSRSVISDSLWPHGLQHTRFPCPSPTPGTYSNSCPLSQWHHPTISSSVVTFSSHLQSFSASGSFQMCQFFTSGGQTIGASASLSVPSTDYSGLISFRIDWFDLLAFQGILKSLLQHHSLNASILRRPTFFMVQLSHPYMTTGKTIASTRQSFVSKVMSLLFNISFHIILKPNLGSHQ